MTSTISTRQSRVNIFEAIKAEIDLEELIEELWGCSLTPAGRGKKTVCRFHEGINENFYVYGDRFWCYCCEASGDISDFYVQVKNMESSVEAVYELAHECGIQLPERDPVLEKRLRERRDRERMLLERAKECHARLDDYPNVRRWLTEKRGSPEEMVTEYLLGVTPDGTAVTISHWDRSGRVQALVLRYLAADEDKKYLYPKLSDYANKERGLMFFGGVPTSGTIYLVEGALDGLAVAAGGECALVIGGDRLSSAQLEELKTVVGRNPKLRMVSLLDGDPAGREAARRIVGQSYPFVRFFDPAGAYEEFAGESAKDPADVLEKGLDVVRGLLKAASERCEDFAVSEARRIAAEHEDEFTRTRLVFSGGALDRSGRGGRRPGDPER